MISDLSSYRLADFIPFSEEVYAALNAYYNESIWPMPLICVVISLGILFWTARRRQISFRIPGCVLSVVWAWVGLVYYRMYFISILPQAEPLIYLCLLQAVGSLLVGLGIGGLRIDDSNASRFWIGWSLFALAALCPITLFWGQAMDSVMLWGWGPTATALGSIGLLVMTSGKGCRWWLTVIPVTIWLLTLTLWLGFVLQ